MLNYTLGIEKKARDSIWLRVLHQAREETMIKLSLCRPPAGDKERVGGTHTVNSNPKFLSPFPFYKEKFSLVLTMKLKKTSYLINKK